MGDASTDAKRRSEPAPHAGIGRLFLSGAVAACIAEATTLPLDTAKVNSQPATSCICSRTALESHLGLHGVICVLDAGATAAADPGVRRRQERAPAAKVPWPVPDSAEDCGGGRGSGTVQGPQPGPAPAGETERAGLIDQKRVLGSTQQLCRLLAYMLRTRVRM